MESDFGPRYEHGVAEEKIYESWEKSGYFNPDNCIKDGITKKDAPVFSIILPPPNVTGELHMGHAAMLVIEDIMVRYNRMKGNRTLWVPGTDHAAIATQSRVEKILAKEEKKNRHDLGRDEFLKRVNEYAQKSHDTIVRQIKRMGASLDWSRETYTLDVTRGHAVQTAFERLYDLGLIYRGHRVVYWDPNGPTVISDDEVVHEERTAKLYTFRYVKEFPIPISTTRPETKVGDTAVAVHPDDPRYQQYIGKEFDVNFMGTSLLIKVIADASVQVDFGTGALGVTPAHSAIDWEMAQKHGLPLVQVIDEHARMTVPGELKGMRTLEAREWIVEQLRAQGLLEKEEDVTQNVSTAERTGAIIEPLPKLQWFIAVNRKFKRQTTNDKRRGKEDKTLKELMLEAVKSGETKIVPEHFEKIYFHWIENLRDWCISRQLWFGHRIPAWYCANCTEPVISPDIQSHWFILRHGETDWNKNNRFQSRTDIPLNETGIAQAKEAATKLKARGVDLVITSPLSRAKQMAEIIAKECGAELIVENDFVERDFGEWEGLGHEEIKNKYSDEMFSQRLEPDFKVPGGESWKEAMERVWNAFQKHHSAHKHKNVVVVGHGGVLRILQYKLKNTPIKESIFIKNAEIWEMGMGDPCRKCGEHFYEQDSDTLDTWFSSGLWPFSVFGWPSFAKATDGEPSPKKGELGPENDLANYFPNSVLETGYDILFFWVARMILMSKALMNDVPFRKVYLHGLVRDAKGRKMSKSLGNGIDPLEMADKYGADATRLSLIIGASAGNDLKLSEDRIRGYRNFSTKIWNVARFIAMNRPANREGQIANRPELEELGKLKQEVTAHIEQFEFHLAGEKLYHYIWHTLADKIVEEQKEKLKNGTDEEKAASYALLEHLLLESLKMLHPFMPFVTEAVHEKFRPGKLLMTERWHAQ
ncbi:MAG: class I tRNA ligase family protein [bacterium]|nr:class I tRNA ligase family protein [bacterium]